MEHNEIAQRLLVPEGIYTTKIESLQEPRESKAREHMFFLAARVKIRGHLKFVVLGSGNLQLTHLVYKTLSPHIVGRKVVVRCKHRKIESDTFEQFDIKEWL